MSHDSRARHRRDRRRYDIEPLTSIMAALDQALNGAGDALPSSEYDEWVLHCLYNLAQKLVDLYATQRLMIDTLEGVATQLLDLTRRERKRR